MAEKRKAQDRSMTSNRRRSVGAIRSVSFVLQTLDGAVGACQDALKPPVYGSGPARYIGRKLPVCSVGLPSGSPQGSRLARTLRRPGRLHPVPSRRDLFAFSGSDRHRVPRASRGSSLVPVGSCEEELL
jgi:hypothetical protein